MKYKWKVEIINETDEEMIYETSGYINRKTEVKSIIKEIIKTLKGQLSI